jgi:hypothetical protein
MAVVRVQVMTSIVGREAGFMNAVAESTALMLKNGLRNAVRVSHSGVPGIEVWSTTMYKDWKEYGTSTDKMLKDSAMQKQYMSSIMDRTGELLDSFEMVEVPGFELGVEPTGDLIAATAWNVFPEEGNLGNFLKSCAEAKALHEKHGARVRLWSAIGGRFAGTMLYSLGFDNFTSMGKWQEKIKRAQANFMSKQPISAEIAAQIILRPPTALGA